MDPQPSLKKLKNAYLIIKCLEIVILTALLGYSMYATTVSLLFICILVVTVVNLGTHAYLFRRNIRKNAKLQDGLIFAASFFAYFVFMGVFLPDYESYYMKGNDTVLQNHGENQKLQNITQRGEETFPFSKINKTNETESLWMVPKILSLNASKLQDLTFEEIIRNPEYIFVYNITLIQVSLILICQCVVFGLALNIKSPPLQGLNANAGNQNYEEIPMQPLVIRNENFELEQDPLEGTSSGQPQLLRNVITHRTRRTSEGSDLHPMEDFDEVSLDSLTVTGPHFGAEKLVDPFVEIEMSSISLSSSSNSH